MTFEVMTTVPVEEGAIDELARLFDQTIRELVSGHDDWLGAWSIGPPRVAVNEILIEM